MVRFKAVHGFDIEIVSADWLIVLSQLHVIEVCGLLIDIVHNEQVVDHLHLMKDITLLELDRLGILDLLRCLGVQLVDINLASLGTQMEKEHLVVEAGHEELVFVTLFVEAPRQRVLRLLLLLLFFLILAAAHEHLEVFVKDAGCHRDICEVLGSALEVIKGSLTEAGLL